MGPGRDLVESLAQGTGYLVTAVTVFELALGGERAHDRRPVDVLLAVPCLALTRGAALRGGDVLRDLRAAGKGIDVRDAMQAGICLEAGLPLVTRNLRHFERVPGLDIVEPSAWGR
jgi:tRNA(fMet)-specific endonuclease VapC